MTQVYSSSNVCLVPQASNISFDAIPSKVYRIMACSRPVLALTDPSSDLARIVGDSGCGKIVSPGGNRRFSKNYFRGFFKTKRVDEYGGVWHEIR